MIKTINKMLKNKKGFTLVELIVVLAVLGIIAAIAVPRFTGVQESAKEKADEATEQIIIKAAELYYMAEDEVDSITVSDLVTEGYLDEAPVFQSSEKADETPNIEVDDSGKATLKWD